MFVSCSNNSNPLTKLNNRIDNSSSYFQHKSTNNNNINNIDHHGNHHLNNQQQLFNGHDLLANNARATQSHPLQSADSMPWLNQFNSMSVHDPTEFSNEYKKLYANYEKQQLSSTVLSRNASVTNNMALGMIPPVNHIQRLDSPPITMAPRPSFLQNQNFSSSSLHMQYSSSQDYEQQPGATGEEIVDYTMVDQKLEALSQGAHMQEIVPESSHIMETNVSNSTLENQPYTSEVSHEELVVADDQVDNQEFQDAATSICNNLSGNKKFQQSKFLKLMRKISDGDVTLKKNQQEFGSQKNEYIGLYSKTDAKNIGPDYFSIEDHTAYQS